VLDRKLPKSSSTEMPCLLARLMTLTRLYARRTLTVSNLNPLQSYIKAGYLSCLSRLSWKTERPAASKDIVMQWGQS